MSSCGPFLGCPKSWGLYYNWNCNWDHKIDNLPWCFKADVSLRGFGDIGRLQEKGYPRGPWGDIGIATGLWGPNLDDVGCYDHLPHGDH